jgi:hypothetical protein
MELINIVLGVVMHELEWNCFKIVEECKYTTTRKRERSYLIPNPPTGAPPDITKIVGYGKR